MIAFLSGKILDKASQTLVLDVGGVGYEIFCPATTLNACGDIGSHHVFYVYSQYRADSVSLFGFLNRQDKELFLWLIKVDSVGPKSALNIMSATSTLELAELINEGQVAELAKLPKISKKTAEHLVVKLKGKLDELLLGAPTLSPAAVKTTEARKLKTEAQTALSHLGYKPYDVEKTLSAFDDDVWSQDLQSIIRHALNELSGQG